MWRRKLIGLMGGFFLLSACFWQPVPVRADWETTTARHQTETGAPAFYYQQEKYQPLWPVDNRDKDNPLMALPDLASLLGVDYRFYNGSKQIVLEWHGTCLTMQINSRQAAYDGKSVALASAPADQNGTFYVPLVDVVRILGGQVAATADGFTISLLPGEAVHTDGPPVEEPVRLLPAAARLYQPVSLMPTDYEPREIQQGDLDGDGQPEAVLSYRTGDGNYGVIIARRADQKWQKIWQQENTFPLDTVRLVNLTGQGNNLLIGRTIGVSAGAVLQVYSMQDDRLELIGSNFYHRLDTGDFNGDGRSELATWQKDTGPTFMVEVWSWDGRRFVPQTDCRDYFADQVVGYYRKLLKTLPEARYVHYYLADAYIRAGQEERALEAIDGAFQLPYGYPGNEQFYILRGHALMAAGDYARAVSAYQAAENLVPEILPAEAHYRLALCYKYLGELNRAREEMYAAIRQGNSWPGFNQAWQQLAEWNNLTQ
ncbi:MAG: tetratricopeptide repeat protein [Desulfurispora sp.]|uniref:tetratricopeptide repeat protein n=1 Tax=Desulfurispora sp. TaxID=3014275 RepID=UPI004049E9B7